MAEGFVEDWIEFLKAEWKWFVPLVVTMLSPLIASGMSIAWDYAKLKGWVR